MQPTPTYVQVSIADYLLCRVLSYTGGSTWLWTPWSVFYVIPGAPIQIRRELETGGEVIAQAYLAGQ